jgi:hypothetical protein
MNLKELQDRGYEVCFAPDGLQVRGPKPTPELQEEIAAHKEQLEYEHFGQWLREFGEQTAAPFPADKLTDLELGQLGKAIASEVMQSIIGDLGSSNIQVGGDFRSESTVPRAETDPDGMAQVRAALYRFYSDPAFRNLGPEEQRQRIEAYLGWNVTNNMVDEAVVECLERTQIISEVLKSVRDAYGGDINTAEDAYEALCRHTLKAPWDFTLEDVTAAVDQLAANGEL